jgi:hypothetical protein
VTDFSFDGEVFFICEKIHGISAPGKARVRLNYLCNSHTSNQKPDECSSGKYIFQKCGFVAQWMVVRGEVPSSKNSIEIEPCYDTFHLILFITRIERRSTLCSVVPTKICKPKLTFIRANEPYTSVPTKCLFSPQCNKCLTFWEIGASVITTRIPYHEPHTITDAINYFGRLQSPMLLITWTSTNPVAYTPSVSAIHVPVHPSGPSSKNGRSS